MHAIFPHVGCKHQEEELFVVLFYLLACMIIYKTVTLFTMAFEYLFPLKQLNSPHDFMLKSCWLQADFNLSLEVKYLPELKVLAWRISAVQAS